MSKTPAHKVRRRPHFFRPVPSRDRKDGWNVERQCTFLAELYFTGSVRASAEAVGMSRTSAYRLRARDGAESFARAWDSVLARPGEGRLPALERDWRKVTHSQLIELVQSGFVRPVIHRGSMTAICRKPDNSALCRLLRREDAKFKRLLGDGAKAQW